MVVEILGTSKLSVKFQITISKEVRARFDLDANDILVFWDDDDKLVLRKSTDR
jgi:AbrB family looped-hinge helix DNA binding protein